MDRVAGRTDTGMERLIGLMRNLGGMYEEKT